MFFTVIALKYALFVSLWSCGHFLKLTDSILLEWHDKSSPFNSTHYVVLYPQNGDLNVTIVFVTSSPYEYSGSNERQIPCFHQEQGDRRHHTSPLGYRCTVSQVTLYLHRISPTGCGQTWRHPLNRKYITHFHAVRGGSTTERQSSPCVQFVWTNPTHQLTDPIQPNPLQAEKIWTKPDPTQYN